MNDRVRIRDERPGVFQAMVDAAGRSYSAQSLIYQAFAIADDAVRSDIECCARQQKVDGRWIYSLTETRPLRSSMTDAEAALQPSAVDLTEALAMLETTQRAGEYIRQRGGAFPWRMVDVPAMPGYVRFVAAEGEQA